MIKSDQNLSVYIIVSIALHLVVYLLFHFGIPDFQKNEPVEKIITFEVVPVGDVSNIKTQKVQNEEKQLEEKAKKVLKSNSEKVEKKEEVAPKQEDSKESEKKEDALLIKEKKEKKKDPVKDLDTPKKNPDKKPLKPKKKTPTNREMDALLKTLEKESEGTEEKSRKRAVGQKSDAIDEAIGKFNEEKPLSISEEQYIRQQIQDKWSVPVGVQNAGDIVITLYIALKRDGSAEQVKAVQISCPSGADIVCKAAVDSGIRAAWQASPFKNLSPERYEIWKEFHINFDPRDVLM